MHIYSFFTKMNHIIHICYMLFYLTLFPCLHTWLPHSTCSHTQFFREYQHCTRSLAWTRVWLVFHCDPPRKSGQHVQAARSGPPSGVVREQSSLLGPLEPLQNISQDTVTSTLWVSGTAWGAAEQRTLFCWQSWLSLPASFRVQRRTYNARALPLHSDPPGATQPTSSKSRMSTARTRCLEKGQKRALQSRAWEHRVSTPFTPSRSYWEHRAHRRPTRTGVCLEVHGPSAEWQSGVQTWLQSARLRNINNSKTSSCLCTPWPQILLEMMEDLNYISKLFNVVFFQVPVTSVDSHINSARQVGQCHSLRPLQKWNDGGAAKLNDLPKATWLSAPTPGTVLLPSSPRPTTSNKPGTPVLELQTKKS